MAYKLIKYKGEYDDDYREYIVDDRDSINDLPTSTTLPDRCAFGSTTICTFDGSIWILSASNVWTEI